MTQSQIDSTPPRRSVDRLWSALTFLWTVAFLAIGAWCTYWADLRNDQYQLINLGQCVHDGGRLYVDCWENKPPGIAWINAIGIALSLPGRIGTWVLPSATALPSLALLWYTLSRLTSPRAARAAVALTAVVVTMRLYDAPSVSPDFYSFVFELSAGSLWLLALPPTALRLRRLGPAGSGGPGGTPPAGVGADDPRGLTLDLASLGQGRKPAAQQRAESGRAGLCFGLAAGLAWSMATTVKQTGCVGLLAVSSIAIALLLARHEDRRRWLRACCFAWIGFLVGGGAVAAVLASQGVLAPAWEAIFTFNRRFVSSDAGATLLRAWPRLQADLGPLQFPLWLSLLAVVMAFARRRPEALSPSWAGVMLLWWFLAAGFALIGPSHSMRYWQATWTPMLLLAAAGLHLLDEAYRRTERAFRGLLTIVLLTITILLCRPLVLHYVYGAASTHVAYSKHPNERQRLRAMGEQLQRLVPEGERIYVLAYHVGVYLYADRRPASRFTYPRSPEQMEQILSDLAAGKAYCILIPQRPAAEFEAWCDEDCHERVQQILLGYEPAGTIDGFDVRLRMTKPIRDPQ